MADRLLKNNRRGAVKCVDYFVDNLSHFKNDFVSNRLSEGVNSCYTKELKLLIFGSGAFKRMILFSRAEVSTMLMDLGLALVNKNDPNALSSLRQLINEAEKYGRLESRIQKLTLGALRIFADIAARRYL